MTCFSETEAIKACFEGMRGVCPDNYTDSYKATITQAQKGCQYKCELLYLKLIFQSKYNILYLYIVLNYRVNMLK